MASFSAATVMAMLALIEATIGGLFVALIWFLWSNYASKNWVKQRMKMHNKRKH